MKDIIQSISHFQGEIVYNLNQHKEKFFHLEYDLGKAIRKLNLSTYLEAVVGPKKKAIP